MPFIYEKISAEDSAKTHWDQCHEYQGNHKPLPSRWTIDRDRDVFLWRINRRRPEQPHHVFGLYWKGNWEIRIKAIETLKEAADAEGSPWDISWDIVKINLPESLKSERDLIQNVLKEAFVIFAPGFDKDVGNIFVSISNI